MTTTASPRAEGTRREPVTATATRRPRRRPFLLDLYSTAVGKKYAMAISGIAMMGFVLFHMIGNLKMYQGAESLDHYAEFLKKLLYPLAPKGTVLWILRGCLISMAVIHIHAAISLTRLNRTARPVRYQSERDYQVANFASRSMRWTGVHLLDLTAGTTNGGNFVRGDAYNNVAHSFDRPVVAIAYIVANIALGVHLFHGVWSLFQSLGWNNPRFNKWRRSIATGVATLIVVGNVSFPIAVLAGIVG